MRAKKSLIALVAVVGGAGALLTGCGQTSNNSITNGSSKGTPSSVNSSLTIGVDNGSPTFQDNFNPFAPGNRIGTSYIYEPLFFVNNINGKVTPWLGTDYKWQNNTTLVVTVRSGVKWNDGRPFSASDVAFTFNYLKKYPALDSQGLWQVLSSVTASGNKVTFKFKSPDVPAFYSIASTVIIPQHVWSSITDPTKVMNANPVGTGPYMVGNFTPEQYILKKNPTYWQSDKVKVKTIVFPVLGNNQTAALKVSSGQWDWATLFLPNVQNTFVNKNPQYNKYWFPAGGVVSLALNLTEAPFNNVQFRQALAYAIHKQQIVKQAEDGYVNVASQTGLILPGQSKWLDSSIPNQGVYNYNLQKAKQLLTQAGYKTNSSGQLLDKSGKPISFSIEVPSGWTDWIQTAQIIQSNLKQLGISVTVSTPQYSAYSSSLSDGQFQGALLGFGGQASPYQAFNSLVNGQSALPVGQSTSQNQERFKDPSVDKVLANWQQSTSQATQQTDANQVQQAVYNLVPVIALFYGATWSEFSTKAFTGWPSASDPYAPPAPYGQPPLMIFTHLKPRS
ncbi:ABC transporter substrate-binding protein [Alicyclobacillus sp. ALC3]|uniref:ABC transporter substrate-binding protein n=1 Tax=Alicyclobacillus sp. ALC3 TaxID=2796143 RepID=UPI002378EFCB|nr:ABC transporter substrate-binding protein [Alicyclobacillus sp. ALC3]WDL96095.1 ABC transporter substrate-binding protein [Alicyclobacillus sp. ALC3]